MGVGDPLFERLRKTFSLGMGGRARCFRATFIDKKGSGFAAGMTGV